MDKKTVTNFRRRIKKAQTSFGAMGEVMLIMELQGMSFEDKVKLQKSLIDSRSPLSYKPLNDMIKKENLENVAF